MTEQRTLDVSRLPDFSILSEAPLWWGQLLLAFIEGTMFAILSRCISLSPERGRVAAAGHAFPPVVLPTVSLALLIVSCLGSYRASEAAKRNDPPRMALWLGFNLVFGTAAMVLRGFSWASFNFKWSAEYTGQSSGPFSHCTRSMPWPICCSR